MSDQKSKMNGAHDIVEMISDDTSIETLQEEIDRLKRENESLRSEKRGTLRLQVSQKGGLSVYGLGRFPVTLYKGQWLRLLEHAQAIRDFIRDNDSSLSSRITRAGGP